MNPTDTRHWERGHAKLKAGAAETLTEAERECLTFYGGETLLIKALPPPAAPPPTPTSRPLSRVAALKAFGQVADAVATKFKRYEEWAREGFATRDAEIDALKQRLTGLEAVVVTVTARDATLTDRVLELEADRAAQREVGP